MLDKVTFTGIKGFKAFSRDLEKLTVNTKSRTVPTMMDILAARILLYAKEKVPVQTGALRASGRIEDTKSQTRRVVAFGGSGTQVMYAAVVEYGRVSYAPFGARPYLRPAVLKAMRKVKPELKKSLKDSLKTMNKRYGHSGVI
tara:strand:- start:158 stop:586 length:429 start_codon:yes stop_codon:yes gene_type:complete